LTLIFTLSQAIACAEAGITLISPFVGRINDGHQVKYGKTYAAHEEPGVHLVKQIFNYYKKFGYKTILMAASLRTAESAFELAGCDRMTIPPSVIDKMETANLPVTQKLKIDDALNSDIEKINVDEKTFRWMTNEDEIGNEKLADGIRQFAKDTLKLEKIIKEKLNI
jgi:transaldolase